MYTDALPLIELLGPMLFVMGAVYVLGPLLPLKRGWARLLIFAVVWLVIARYLNWRFVETVLPARGAWYEIGWIWLSCGQNLKTVGSVGSYPVPA